MNTEPVRQIRYTRPSGATEIVLVRHGESEPFHPANPFPLVDGHGDPALAPEGHDQAERVGEALHQEEINGLYVTSLRRTHQTAAPLAERRGITPTVERDLREVFLGEFEGGVFRLKMREGSDPAIAEFLDSGGEWGVLPGAESTTELEQRCVSAILRIAGNHPDQQIVCVVHGGVIGALLGHANRVPHRVFGFGENGSFSRIMVHSGSIAMRSFNEIAHLR